MTQELSNYIQLLDALRKLRETPSRAPEDDEPFLEELGRIWDALDAVEQEIADNAGWRSWPDQYAAGVTTSAPRIDEAATIVDVSLDAAECDSGTLPRRVSKAA